MFPMAYAFLFAACIACSSSQPVFPEGVAPLLASVSEKQKSATASTDDADKVNALAQGAGAAVQEDLAEEAAPFGMSSWNLGARLR